MDWTMIANAEGAVMRLQTLYYLLKDRYQLSAAKAAEQLLRELKDNALCTLLLNDLKTETYQPTADLGMGEVYTDTEVRSYFKELLLSLEGQISPRKRR